MCVYLGHKAVASEITQPGLHIMGFEHKEIISHSEEHIVIRTTEADNWKVGDLLYAIPWHLCQIVDSFYSVSVVNEHKVTGQ